MSKHTPGPWNTMVSGGSVWSSGGEWVCDPSDRHAYPTDTQRANARLIAAAPDMLEALEAVVAWQDGDGDFNLHAIAAEEQVRAAIAKAKGEDA